MTAAGDFFLFLAWHYGAGLRAVAQRARVRVFAVLNFFSVAEHARTLVSPWRRIAETYGSGFDPLVFVQVFIGNVFSRVIGLAVRSAVILLGIAGATLAALFGAAAVVFWILLPALIPSGFLLGLAAVLRF